MLEPVDSKFQVNDSCHHHQKKRQLKKLSIIIEKKINIEHEINLVISKVMSTYRYLRGTH